MRVITWAGINSFYLWCIYAGFIKGIEGAWNVAIAWGWLAAVIGILCLLCSDEIKKKSEKTPRVIALLDPLVDATAAVVFIWFGHIALGIATFLALAGFKAARK